MLVIAAAAMISMNACGQNAKDVPVNVKSAFAQKFPGVQNVKWGKENASEWEAEFKMNTKEYSANFNSDGTWLETEYEIAPNEIPAAVTNTLGKEFPGYKLVESEISETAKGKVYEFEIKTGTTKTEVALLADGTLVKKEAVTKGKEGKD